MGETGKRNESICVPGQRLCLSDENTVSGEGTYERQGYIYSLLAGVVNVSQKDKVSCSKKVIINKCFHFNRKFLKLIISSSRKLLK